MVLDDCSEFECIKNTIALNFLPNLSCEVWAFGLQKFRQAY